MANEFIVRKGLVVSGASQQALRTVGNGNILIGSGSTDNGYTLQVLGGSFLKGSGTTTSSYSLITQNNSGTVGLVVNDSSNVLIGTTTDVGAKLNVSGIFASSYLAASNTSIGTIENSDRVLIYSSGSDYGIRGFSYSATFTISSSYLNNGAVIRLYGNSNSTNTGGTYITPRVGINTTSPLGVFHIKSTGSTTTSGNTFVITTSADTRNLTLFNNGNLIVGSGSTDLGSTLSVIGSSLMSGNTSGSTLLNVVGSQGQLFSVVDTLTGSLMSVNDITGLPILEVFSDDRVVMGEYATNALVVSGRSTGFGVTPSDPNYRIISSGSTLFSGGTMVVKGSGTTSGSTAFVVQNSTGGTMVLVNNFGNVRIGTSTDSGYRLDVNGILRTVSGVIGTELGGYVTSGGHKVQIVATGTATPLMVTGGSGAIEIWSNSTPTFASSFGAARPGLSVTNDFVFSTYSTSEQWNERMRITNSGNLLIGTTTNAGYRLDVNGNFRTIGDNFLATSSGTTSVGAISQAAKFYVRGSGTTSASRAFMIENSAQNGRIVFRDDRKFIIEINDTGGPTHLFGANGSHPTYTFNSSTTYGTIRAILDGEVQFYDSAGVGSTALRISGRNNLILEGNGNIRFHTNGSLGSMTERMRINNSGTTIIGFASAYTPDNFYKLQVSGTSLFTGTFTSLTGGSSQVLYNMDLSQSAITGNTIYAVNISPTLRNTASGQTQVALRVMPTFTGSSTGTSTTNKIVDFGSANVGTQFTVTDATTGDIYMVNDVSGLPIIAATSDWDVSMYNYPNTVFKKTNNSLLFGVQNNTGSTISMYGDVIIDKGFGIVNTTTQVSGTTSTGATSATTIYTLTTSTNKSYSMTCLTTGYGNTTRNTTSGRIDGTFKNSGGTVTLVGTTIQYISSDEPSTNVDFEVSGTSIVLRVTGTTTENYTWGSTITSQVI